jgi:hypothetical protein
MAFEHLPEQLEFRAQVLLLRFVRPLGPQLVPEHVDEHLLDVVDAVRPGEEFADLAATGLLRRRDVL